MSSVSSTDFDLVTDVRRGFIAARVRAIAISPELAAEFLRDIRKALAAERLGYLMLEFELAHALTDSEVYDVMRTFSSLMSGLRIAVVNRDPRHHPSLQFGVTVSQQFGQDFRYFADAKPAEAWLTGR